MTPKNPLSLDRVEQGMSGIALTHPERVLYSEQAVTKLELATYYAAVSEAMLPYLADRPLTLVRCPRGREKTCFFQQYENETVPDVLTRIPVEEKQGPRNYMAVKDLAGLMALVQLGVLEIHLWGWAPALHRPDWIVFDLDPGPGVVWRQVITAANRLHRLLSELDLRSFPMTTGGKGLHVVVPIERRWSWEDVKEFSEDVVQQIAAEAPSLYTTSFSKAQRRGKIFLDYLRNDRGATSIAPYSTRARAGALLAVPLDWNELSPKIHADYFNVRNVPGRLAILKKDPWRDFFAIHQSLPHVSKSSTR